MTLVFDKVESIFNEFWAHNLWLLAEWNRFIEKGSHTTTNQVRNVTWPVTYLLKQNCIALYLQFLKPAKSFPVHGHACNLEFNKNSNSS